MILLQFRRALGAVLASLLSCQPVATFTQTQEVVQQANLDLTSSRVEDFASAIAKLYATEQLLRRLSGTTESSFSTAPFFEIGNTHGTVATAGTPAAEIMLAQTDELGMLDKAGGTLPDAVVCAPGRTCDISQLSVTSGGQTSTSLSTLLKHAASINSSGALSILNGPTLGTYRNGRYTAQSDAVQIGKVIDLTGRNPIYSVMDDNAAPGQGVFGPSHVMIINRTGGNGNREAVHIEATSAVGQIGDQIVGGIAAGRIVSGNGTAYGFNPYARVDPTAGPGSQTVGQEINVDARRDVTTKVGQQIVDVSTSIGIGTSIDASLIMAKQIGATGFLTGLQFGYSSNDTQSGIDAAYGVRAGGTLINSLHTTLSLRAGLDLSRVQAPFTDAAIKLGAGNTIKFGEGGIGGTISSLTASAAGSILFGTNLTIIDFAGGHQNMFTADGYTTTGFITQAKRYGPPTSSSSCTVGQSSWDENYEYRCVAPNTWKRVALSTW